MWEFQKCCAPQTRELIKIFDVKIGVEITCVCACSTNKRINQDIFLEIGDLSRHQFGNKIYDVKLGWNVCGCTGGQFTLKTLSDIHEGIPFDLKDEAAPRGRVSLVVDTTPL